jgi:hypothetical protein
MNALRGFAGEGKSFAMKTGIMPLLLMLAMFPSVSAQVSFYSGDVCMDTFDADIDLRGRAVVSLECLLVNRGSEEESVSLRITGVPGDADVLLDSNPFSEGETVFGPGEEKTLKIDYVPDINVSNNLNVLSLGPRVFFDDMHNSERVGTYNVRLALPEGVKSIVSSSRECSSMEIENRRTVYYWSENDIYPTALSIMWSSLDADISLMQEADHRQISDVNQQIGVTVTIENKGENELSDVLLSTYFVPSEFEAVEPLEDFEQPEPGTDYMLKWSRGIGRVGAGETKTLHYSVRPKSLSHALKLEPVTARVNNSLVGVSNEIGIEVPSPGAYGTETTMYVILGLLVPVSAVALLVFRRKIKSKRHEDES